MFEELIKDFTNQMEEKMEELVNDLKENFNFMRFEKVLSDYFNSVMAQIMEELLADLLSDKEFLASLKKVGTRKGMRFKGYKTITIYLTSGQKIKIRSPYFSKALPKDKKRALKRGPNGSGSHLGLECLGFIGRASPQLVSEVVKLSVLCPSSSVTREVLAGRGIIIGIKVIRRLCRDLAKIGTQSRGKISLEEDDTLLGLTLVIGIDGGRLRERGQRKKKKEGQKRDGYESDWKEPKLFAIYLLDETGKRVKQFEYLYDATMGNCHRMFDILEKYLNAIGTQNIARVVFCGDGAEWIWNGAEKLIKKLKIDDAHQILDYTHAVQNLAEIINLLPAKIKTTNAENWHKMLWEGDIDGLHQQISQLLTGSKKKLALKKWTNYFQKNQKRMQYKTFKAMKLPCGSGFVESAIRRVINMRLKSAGSFWKREMAEYMLFLRSQFLSGRWTILLRNITTRTAKILIELNWTNNPKRIHLA